MNKTRAIEAGQWLAVGILIFLIYKFIERESLTGIIQKGLSPREAGILEGILLGSKEGMSSAFYEKLKISGLIHIVVASGANLMLISKVLIENLSMFLGRKKTLVMALAAMWGYAGLVGWQAPIVRATLFLSIRYLAWVWGRRFNWIRALAATIVIMVAADWEMLKSISFWMSVVAFVAVSISKPKIKLFKKLKSGFWKGLGETMWVSLWLTPLLAFSFGKLSWVAPLTNILVLFLVEVVSLWGGMAVIVGLIWSEAGKYLLWLLWPALKYFSQVVEWGSSAGVINIKFNWMIMAGVYMLLIYFYRRQANHENVLLGTESRLTVANSNHNAGRSLRSRRPPGINRSSAKAPNKTFHDHFKKNMIAAPKPKIKKI